MLKSKEHGSQYGFELNEPIEPEEFIKDGDDISFGIQTQGVLYSRPCGWQCLFWNEEQKFVVVGDVLFLESIGRTDFPTGNFDILHESIFTKLFTLPQETIVYSGHGPETTIGHEMKNNPFYSSRFCR